MFNNYQIVLNLIPEIRRELGDNILSIDKSTAIDYAGMVSDSIIRYIGDLSDQLDVIQKELRNPIIWIREGFSWVMLLPLLLLYWIGLIGGSFVEKVSNNPLFKILAGIVTLLGVASTNMTIIMGWDAFVTAVKVLFNL